MRSKRLLDFFAAVIGLLAVAPVLALAAMAILLESGRPVLFSQVRVGRAFKQFRMHKLRTMQSGSTGLSITASDDARVTHVGKVLRLAKVDELPQLMNVIKGEMSLVGPRPEVPQYVDAYRMEYAKILAVRPGITDLASIKYRNESRLLAASPDPERTYLEEILPDKISLAMDYVANQSLWLDAKILVRTAASIFLR